MICQLKLYKNGRLVHKTTRKKKVALLHFIKAKFSSDSINKVNFKVIYSRDNVNEGAYTNLEDFTQAYQAFTSSDLIKEWG